MIELKNKPLENIEVTSEYGIRALGGLEFHPGIDYKAPLGAPIYAVDDGKVVVAKNDAEGYGLYVVIEHSNYCTLYAHMKALEVKVGQSIKAGQIIGHIGLTGMTTGAHLHFEIRDCLYDTMFWIKSLLKGRHAMCIDPKGLVEEARQVSRVRYKKYSDRIHELRGNPEDLAVEIVNKRIWDIVEFTDCMNGTFFYPDGKGGLYSTSILYVEGKTYQDTANHYWNFGTPQSVFIVYKDNTVDLKRIKFLSELDLSKVRLAIGGVGLRNTQDSNFYYSPVTEGFKAGYNLKGEWKDFTDVLKKRNKSVLGYNKRLNKVYMLTVRSVAHGELIKIISDNSTGEAYDIAISVDGGGSTFMDALGKYVFQGENTRRIHNILRFK
jgi:murein DD-endopeptidase MepM/ murein hydrolase activator NlpD